MLKKGLKLADMTQEQLDFLAQSDNLEINLPAGTPLENWSGIHAALKEMRADRPFRLLIAGEEVKEQ